MTKLVGLNSAQCPSNDLCHRQQPILVVDDNVTDQLTSKQDERIDQIDANMRSSHYKVGMKNFELLKVLGTGGKISNTFFCSKK